MEGIVALLVIVFVVASISASSKKKPQGDPKAQNKPVKNAKASASASNAQLMRQNAALLRRNVARMAARLGIPEAEYVRRLPMALQRQYADAVAAETAVPAPAPHDYAENGSMPGTGDAYPIFSEGESLQDADGCLGGSMTHAHDAAAAHPDEEGCLGGSMAHSHTEGETRVDHERHMARADAEAKADAAEPIDAAKTARERLGLTASDMRRAVVISEILGRPKALSARGRAR